MKKAAFLALASGILAGCSPAGEPAKTVDADAREEIRQLKTQLALLKFESALARMDSAGLGSEYATFDVHGTQSYTKLKAPVGAVLATLDRVEPYLNGFNVFVRVGNPSTAHLHGVSGEIKWGKSDEATEMQSKKFELLDTFPPGSWRTVKLTIGPADAQSTQKIVFAPTFNQISLNKN